MYSFTHSLTSALDGGEWSASRPGRFTSRKTDPGTEIYVINTYFLFLQMFTKTKLLMRKISEKNTNRDLSDTISNEAQKYEQKKL
jgi:hypothetical protein